MAAVIAAVAIGVGAGTVAGVWIEGGTDPAMSAGSVEVGFARDMSRHHEQAVAMAEIIRTRTADAELLALATDIGLTQQSQIGRMRGWIDVWGAPVGDPAPSMAWMGHRGAMPGMASPAQLARLQSEPVDVAERLFVELMIAHHRGGVAMAEAAVEKATKAEVHSLARSIVTSQSAEIAVLEDLASRLAAQ